ncbi:hypothetical protein DAPPUDRAFT_233882 [Daphnia pulex]|uniref:Uncharacterized protein n=1 Tax=Daphnia pulex TaxID=6669 RepID=E9FW07_DAPPU|nr:hypothetical protein DAPPUDRAFT_233882 [Daphnia pulex]|eukprot:EFX88641.1 hypothetical protein DAPPUDRAFT_233882 [Daphnia pulex]
MSVPRDDLFILSRVQTCIAQLLHFRRVSPTNNSGPRGGPTEERKKHKNGELRLQASQISEYSSLDTKRWLKGVCRSSDGLDLDRFRSSVLVPIN